jgi:hypothetical protein
VDALRDGHRGSLRRSSPDNILLRLAGRGLLAAFFTFGKSLLAPFFALNE